MKTLCYVISALAVLFSSLAYADKPFLSVETGGHMAMVRDIMFTKDGNYLVSASDDKTIRVWDVSTGEMVRKISGQIGVGDHGKIYAAAISPDNRRLAIGGYLAYGRSADISNVGNIRIFNFHTGEIEKLLKGHGNIINSLAFSHDGTKLVSGSYDKTARIWDLNTGKTLNVLTGHKNTVYAVSFSPNNQTILTGSADKTMKLWNARTGLLKKTINGHTDTIKAAVYTPDGRYILSGGYDKTIRLWDGYSGEFIKIMATQMSNISILSVDSAGTKVLTGHGCCESDSPNNVFSIPSGKKLTTFGKHENIVIATAISPDGKTAATAGGTNNEIYTWDITTGNVKKLMKGKGTKTWAVGFSKDGRSIAWGRKYSKYDLFEWGPLEQSFQIKSNYREFDVTMGDVIQSASKYQTGIKSAGPWTIKTKTGKIHKVLQILKNGNIHHEIDRGNLDIYQSYALTMTPDGQTVISGEGTGSIYSYDPESGKELHEFIGHTGCIWAVAASPDSRFLVSGSDDQTIRLWEIATGKLLLTIFPALDGEWVAWTPEGYYTCSVNGDKYVGWHINRGDDKSALYYPASRFARQFYSPQIVAAYLSNGGNINGALTLVNSQSTTRKKVKKKITDINSILPPAVFFQLPSDTNVSIKRDEIRIKAVAKSMNKEPIKDIWLLINGKRADKNRAIRMDSGNGKNINGLRAELDVTIPLTQKINKISVIASNRYSQSEPEIVNVTWEKGAGKNIFKPNLYLLSIGVSEYQDSSLNLDVAHKDAKGIVDVFTKQTGRLYNSVKKRLLTNAKATKDDILDGLDWILEEATQKDVAIIFVAGHGIKDDGGNYYFVPHDGKINRLRRTSVKWFDFQDVLARIPSKVILMVDTCHSGSVTGKRRGVGDMTDALRELVNAESGVVVMTASTGREMSQERPEWGHGAFTKAIIEGLNGKANYDNNNTIDIKELDLFVTTRVKALTNGKQHPTTEIPKTLPNFPLMID